jgi:hypothetical protein
MLQGADELVHRGAVEALLLAASQETVDLASRTRALDVLAYAHVQLVCCASTCRCGRRDVAVRVSRASHLQRSCRAARRRHAAATLRDVDARVPLLQQECVGRSIERASSLAAKIGPVRVLLATELLHEYAKHATVSEQRVLWRRFSRRSARRSTRRSAS